MCSTVHKRLIWICKNKCIYKVSVFVEENIVTITKLKTVFMCSWQVHKIVECVLKLKSQESIFQLFYTFHPQTKEV